METENIEYWVKSERKKVKEYLEKEGIENPNIGECPAFEVNPYFAIWAIESKKSPEKIGWWAFSGDCPTDYVSEDGKCNPRNALENLINKWKEYVPSLKSGKQPKDVNFGKKSELKEFGKLLEDRIKVLEEWLMNNDIWEER